MSALALRNIVALMLNFIEFLGTAWTELRILHGCRNPTPQLAANEASTCELRRKTQGPPMALGTRHIGAIAGTPPLTFWVTLAAPVAPAASSVIGTAHAPQVRQRRLHAARACANSLKSSTA